jgi:tetratricopeptide (TPR) repeat protein
MEKNHRGTEPERSKRGSYLLAVAVFLWFCGFSAYAADKWTSIHTRNFTLAGNASESDIRRIGRTLEEFRSAIAMTFPKMDQTSPVSTTILVFKNEESFKPYKPLYQGQPSNAMAFFQPGEDVNYIALSAAVPPNVILHEYIHFLLRDNVGSLPLWIMEGLAECYSTFDLTKNNEFTLGRAPEQHVATLSMAPQFIPLKRLLTIQEGSPEYNEESKQGMFYAESWATVHYFLFGAEGKRRNQFTQLLAALSKGDPFEDSFGEAFQTDYGTVEDEVREYIRKRNSWPMLKVTSKDPIQVDNRANVSTTLSDAESEYYLGDLLLHLNRLSDADSHLTAAASKSPNLVPAAASLALLRVRQKKYDDALSLLKKAAEADSKNPMIAFYYGYVLERADADAAASIAMAPAERLETMRSSAKKSIELSPRFVEAYALLARANLNAGEHLDEAEATLKKALSISPGREDFQMLLVQTYLRANRTADARSLLEVIARNTSSIDMRKRAMAMLDQTEPTFALTEIPHNIDKEATKDEVVRPQPAAAPPAPPSRRAQETVLEALTPAAPTVSGEKVTGLLINLDCGDGLTLRVRTDRNTIELHSSNPDKIQFLSYTADVTDNIKCGPRNPGTPVNVTYRPVSGGMGEPLVLEFLEKK